MKPVVAVGPDRNVGGGYGDGEADADVDTAFEVTCLNEDDTGGVSDEFMVVAPGCGMP
ncbi:hypothetical protein [Noviherbaspirillum pedocola]|uniref:Uncharacterized protein n=1 Tax=Noviherbaspirillum pedocola TaxID=2801341 RepID=A0A934SS36_9BURK|nr:hypothetical protein [Noviherbaspirillum pedocola]MBK4735736.1 hypothetical protein [Noviherbaspirillum pedocola]